MKRENEILILVGLLAVLAVTSGEAVSGYTEDDTMNVIDKIAYAIAVAEGFFTTGSRPQRNHNPGDFERDLMGTAVGKDGPYIVYASDDDGWAALKHQVKLMFGGSSIYNPSMTISQVAYHYADGMHDPDGAAAWASNVAQALAVTTDTPLSAIQV